MTPATFAIRRGPLKYIQYHCIRDIEELYHTGEDPGELTSLIDDPAYLDDRIELRQALFEALTTNEGTNAVPCTARLAQGMNLHDRNGAGAAEFPAKWRVLPDRPDRYSGIFPDTPLKARLEAEGKPYAPFMEHVTAEKE